MRPGRLALNALLTILLAACIVISQPLEVPARPFNAESLVPEDWYRLLHEQIENCTGYRRSYDALSWWVVPRDEMPEGYAGIWSWRSNIYLQRGFEMSGQIIAHELGHYVTQLEHGAQFDALMEKCGVPTR